jgi:hypothetical protein
MMGSTDPIEDSLSTKDLVSLCLQLLLFVVILGTQPRKPAVGCHPKIVPSRSCAKARTGPGAPSRAV